MRYLRDLDHNYMVFEAARDNEPSYRMKMITRNRVKGLLPVEFRRINGREYLYYRIDNLQPLSNRFVKGGMKKKDLKAMMSDLSGVLAELKEVLLGEEGLFLSVDSVFTDIRTGDYCFTYLPVDTDEGGAAAEAFFEELLDHTDTNDDEAIEYVYDLCERSQIKGISLKELIGEEAAPPVADVKEEEPVRIRKELPIAEEVPFEAEFFSPDEKPVKDVKKSGVKFYITSFALPVLFTLVLFADVYIRASYELGERERLLSTAVAAVALLCGAGTMLTAMKRVFREPEEEEMPGALTEDEIFPLPEKEVKVLRMPERKAYMEGLIEREDIKTDTRDLKATRLLAGGAAMRRPKLYGRCGDENVNIPVDDLPLIIGKQAGLSDFLLKDDTVSRMHARLFRDVGNVLKLKDLNSTNGTMINGERLGPGEDKTLSIGDEICFGNMVFEYR